jgi:O-antigen/teichoic acid export membrane protein
LFSAVLFFDAIAAIPFAQLRLQNKALRFATIKIINIVTNLVLNVLFIVVLNDIAEGNYLVNLTESVASFYHILPQVAFVFLANLIASILTFFLLIPSFVTQDLKWNAEEWQKLLNYSFPLLIMGLAGVTNEMLSRAMLKNLLPENFYPEYSNQAALGIFGACYKLSIFMTLAIQAFRYAAEPFFFSRSDEQNSPSLFASLMHWFIIFGCVVFLGISLNLEWIAPILIRNEAYLDGLEVVPILLLANLFLGINFNLSVWYKLTDKTRFGALIAIIGAFITIVLNIALIPVYGFLGSAYVTLFTYFAMSIISLFIGKRYYPVPYRYFRMLMIIATSVILFFGMTPLNFGTLFISSLIKTMVVLTFGALMIWTEYRLDKRRQG